MSQTTVVDPKPSLKKDKSPPPDRMETAGCLSILGCFGTFLLIGLGIAAVLVALAIRLVMGGL